jgi:hypothetical protein
MIYLEAGLKRGWQAGSHTTEETADLLNAGSTRRNSP